MQGMWVVCRDQEGQARMYWCGGGDFSSDSRFVACWTDRRAAHDTTKKIAEMWPGDRRGPYVYGEAFIPMLEADPQQIVSAA